MQFKTKYEYEKEEIPLNPPLRKGEGEWRQDNLTLREKRRSSTSTGKRNLPLR